MTAAAATMALRRPLTSKLKRARRTAGRALRGEVGSRPNEAIGTHFVEQMHRNESFDVALSVIQRGIEDAVAQLPTDDLVRIDKELGAVRDSVRMEFRRRAIEHMLERQAVKHHIIVSHSHVHEAAVKVAHVHEPVLHGITHVVHTNPSPFTWAKVWKDSIDDGQEGHDAGRESCVARRA